MARSKKEKTPKFYVDEPATEIVKKVLASSPTFSHLPMHDIQVLLKAGKNKLGKKHVNIKILKEPITLVSAKKLIVLITDEWWKEEIDSVRIKDLIEAFIGVVQDEEGLYVKRDYDVQTYAELLKDSEYDFSQFSKILPAEAKPETLVLTSK